HATNRLGGGASREQPEPAQPIALGVPIPVAWHGDRCTQSPLGHAYHPRPARKGPAVSGGFAGLFLPLCGEVGAEHSLEVELMLAAVENDFARITVVKAES